MQFTCSTWVDAEPDEVFDFANDLSKCDRWMKNLVAIRTEDGGPVREGAKVHETRKMFGKEHTEVFEVTRFERPAAVGMHVDSCSGKASYDFSFRYNAEGDGTRITLDGQAGSKGLIAKLMAPMGKRMFTKMMNAELAALKAAVELEVSPAAGEGDG